MITGNHYHKLIYGECGSINETVVAEEK